MPLTEITIRYVMILDKPPKKKKTNTFRKIKNMDTNAFMKGINDNIKKIESASISKYS